MFMKMDTDGDGIVSVEELKTGLRNFGSQLAESEVQMLIEAVSILYASQFQVSSNSICALPKKSNSIFSLPVSCFHLQQQHQWHHCNEYISEFLFYLSTIIFLLSEGCTTLMKVFF